MNFVRYAFNGIGPTSLYLRRITDLRSPGKLSCYTAGVVLNIVKYGHPVLRQKGQRIERIAAEHRQLAADMLETMRAADGVGLAAQQIGRPILLTVIDVSPSEHPWSITPQFPMPLVLVNPRLSQPEGEQIGNEGCLSVPEVTAEIQRAAKITVHAQSLDGKDIVFDCTGLLARAAQHEVDHLNGILFVDRMDAATRVSFAGKLKKLQKETQAGLDQAKKPRRSLARL
jgi:peptide deformylase